MSSNKKNKREDDIDWLQDKWQEIKSQEHLFQLSSSSYFSLANQKENSKIHKQKISKEVRNNNTQTNVKKSNKYFSPKLYHENLIKHIEMNYNTSKVSSDEPVINFKQMTLENATIKQIEAMPFKEFGESIDFYLDHILPKSYVDFDDSKLNDQNL